MLNGGVGGVGRAGRAPDPRIVHVVEVVDGDTLRVRFVSGTVRRLRHVGIEALACTGNRQRLEHGRLAPRGSRLRLEFDADRVDDSGVLLAHAYRTADGQMVGARLLEAGVARVRTVAPNVRHLRRLQAAARTAARGACSG